MLGKLLKHEFRATARVMLPFFGIFLLLAVLANLSARVLDSSQSVILEILGSLVMVAFGFGIVAVGVMALVIMISRFSKNLLGDEGYLTLTLPVSVHGLVWSKIIVSTVWFVASAAVIALSGVLASFRVSYVSRLFEDIRQLFGRFFTYFSADWAVIGGEALAVILLGCVFSCLFFYAAIAVGHSFANHKGLLSVVFVFAFQFAVQFITTAALVSVGENLDVTFSGMAGVQAALGAVIGIELLYCAVFYLLTTWMLKRHLNLG